MKNFRAYPLYIQTFSSTHLNEYVFVSLSNNAQSFSFQNFVYFFFFFSIYYRSKIHGLEWFRDCVTAPSDRWIFDRKLTEIRLIEALCSRHGSLSMLSFPDRSFKYTYLSCFDSQKKWLHKRWSNMKKRFSIFSIASKCSISNFARPFSISELIEI